MARKPYGEGWHVLEFEHAGKPGIVGQVTRARLGAIDTLAFELGRMSPQPRVWINGEVAHEGEGFATRAEPRPGAR